MTALIVAEQIAEPDTEAPFYTSRSDGMKRAGRDYGASFFVALLFMLFMAVDSYYRYYRADTQGLATSLETHLETITAAAEAVMVVNAEVIHHDLAAMAPGEIRAYQLIPNFSQDYLEMRWREYVPEGTALTNRLGHQYQLLIRKGADLKAQGLVISRPVYRHRQMPHAAARLAALALGDRGVVLSSNLLGEMTLIGADANEIDADSFVQQWGASHSPGSLGRLIAIPEIAD